MNVQLFLTLTFSMIRFCILPAAFFDGYCDDVMLHCALFDSGVGDNEARLSPGSLRIWVHNDTNCLRGPTILHFVINEPLHDAGLRLMSQFPPMILNFEYDSTHTVWEPLCVCLCVFFLISWRGCKPVCVCVIFTGAGHSSSFLRSAEEAGDRGRDGGGGGRGGTDKNEREGDDGLTKVLTCTSWKHSPHRTNTPPQDPATSSTAMNPFVIFWMWRMFLLTDDNLNSGGHVATATTQWKMPQSVSRSPNFSFTSNFILFVFHLPGCVVPDGGYPDWL